MASAINGVKFATRDITRNVQTCTLDALAGKQWGRLDSATLNDAKRALEDAASALGRIIDCSAALPHRPTE